MKKTKLKKTDMLSADKSKKLEKMAEKVLKFCRENNIARLSVSFLSQDITEEDDKRYGNYVNVCLSDIKKNDLYDVCIWEERV